ncbi:MAG: GNAT family N-acetyltransferase [Promethearchaeota archaeon]
MVILNIEIKSLLSGQIDEICKIHNLAFSEWIDTLGMLYGYRKVTKKDVMKWVEPDNADILIAYEDKVPVGYLHYQIVKTKGVGEGNDILRMEIIETTEGRGQSKIAVLPEKRRNGIAIKLLRQILTLSKELNIDVVTIYAYNHNQVINNILHELSFIHEPIFFYPPYSNTKPFAHDSVLAEFDLSKDVPSLQHRNNDEICIREFQPNDLADIQQIFIECRPDMIENSSEDEIGTYWLEEKWAMRTLVMEFKGEVVGCMEYNKLGLIGIPGVKKNYQRKGIGSALLNQLLKDMKFNGFTKALADTGLVLQNAIALYNKFNFNASRELWVWVKVI